MDPVTARIVVGAARFDVTWTNTDDDKERFRRNVSRRIVAHPALNAQGYLMVAAIILWNTRAVDALRRRGTRSHSTCSSTRAPLGRSEHFRVLTPSPDRYTSR
jgi:hypothetical protein